MIVEISDSQLKVGISTDGGGIVSIIYLADNIQLQWQKQASVWNAQDIIMFPFIGSGAYSVDGQEYSCESRHGLARDGQWSVVRADDNSVKLLLSSNKYTKINYPFDFELTACYVLEDGTLTVTYDVVNNDGCAIPYYIGGHLGINLFGESQVCFDKMTNILYRPLIDGFVATMPIPFANTECIKLDKQLFVRYDTLILENNFNNITICGDKYEYAYHFDSPVVALWSNASAGQFVCVEPWWGLCPCQAGAKELNHREYINIAAKKQFSYSLSVNCRHKT